MIMIMDMMIMMMIIKSQSTRDLTLFLTMQRLMELFGPLVQLARYINLYKIGYNTKICEHALL